MSLREQSEAEQREARIHYAIEESSRRFHADMDRLNSEHDKSMKRIAYWSAWFEGATIGVFIGTVLVFVIYFFTK